MAFQELRRHSNTFRPPLQIPFNRPKQGRESWLYVKGYKICRKGFAKNMEPCKPAGLISKKYGTMQVCRKGFAKNMEPCKPAGLISKKYGTMQACIRGSWKNMEPCKPAELISKKYGAMQACMAKFGKKLAQPNSSYSNNRRQYHMGTIIATWVRALY